jgi:fibronectin type 3 domain-containing protein
MFSQSSSRRDRKRSQPSAAASASSGRDRRRYRLGVFELLELREMLSGNTYTVTDVSDSASSSGLTLRGAIAAANADTGTATDTIVLGSNTYNLTQSVGELSITNSTHSLIIEGQGSSGPNATIIDQQFIDRVFEIAANVNVTFEDLEITGGTATNDGNGGVSQSSGGGILSFGTVDLENVAVINNKSQNSTTGVGTGGGIFATGPVTINQSLISGNSAIGGTAGGGALLSSGTLTITDSVIENNTATGTFVSTGSTIGGVDAFGGGIYSDSANAVVITGNTIQNNIAQGASGQNSSTSGTNGGSGMGGLGGGFYVDVQPGSPTLVLTANTIANNQALGGLGGVGGANANGGVGGEALGGAMIIGGLGSAAMTNNTFSGNLAHAGAGGGAGSGGIAGIGGNASGGAIFTSFPTAVFQDTIYGNIATGGNGSTAGSAFGGAIEDDAAQNSTTAGVTVLASTIAGNGAVAGTPTSGGTAGLARGGGIDNSAAFLTVADSFLQVAGTIVANNTATSGPDVDGFVWNSFNNLIGNGTDGSGFNVARGDLVGTSNSPINPMLGALQNNGGVTQTMALLTGSPALGMGDPTADTTASLTTDQRGIGFARIVAGKTDIGALETQATAVTAPTVTGTATTEGTRSTTGLVLTPSSSGTNYFQITGITGGTLYQHDGVTPINNGDFISLAQGAAGLKFTPTAGSLISGNFTAQESTGNSVGGLDGSTTSATITVTFNGPSVTPATTPVSTPTSTGLVITPGSLDTAAYFEITGITGGTLFQNDGTTPITNGQFITVAQGLAGLKFTPSSSSTGGGFTIQESIDNTVGGLSGPTAVATITVAGSTQSVNLSGYYNRTGITNDGAAFAGGLDAAGNALSAQQLGSSVTSGGLTYALGPVGTPDSVTAYGQLITLPQGNYSQIDLLAVGVNGNQPNQTFIVTYTDGSTQTISQSISDWFAPQGYSGESVAASINHRNTARGGADNRTFHVYSYALSINSSKTVASITLPTNSSVEILSMDVAAPIAGPPALSAVVVSPYQVNLAWTAPGGSNVTGYNIYRSTSSGGVPTLLNSTPLSASAINFTDHSVVPGNTYTYKIVSVGTGGTSAPSNEVAVNTPTVGTSTEIDLTGNYNLTGIVTQGTAFSGGLDGVGNALVGSLLGSSQTVGSTTFAIAPVGMNNVIEATGQTIDLPAQSFSQLQFLATSTNGNQISEPFVVHYTDGTSQTYYQSLSDWGAPQGFAGETLALQMAYRAKSTGGVDTHPFDVYEYSLPTDGSKTVQSITLPQDVHVAVLAISGVAPVSAATNLVVTTPSATEADLAWSAAGAGTTGYNVYRGTAAGGESTTPLNSVPLSAGTTSYQDTTALAGNTYFYVVKAISGSTVSAATNEASVTLASSGTTNEVDLNGQYNQVGITADGAKFSGGIDGTGDALSATQLGTSQTVAGTPFTIAAAGANNVVVATGQTVGLPNGNFSQIELLAVGVNGNQPSQTFVVHYTDGTSVQLSLSLSDWGAPQSYSNQTIAVSGYRNTASGGRDNRSFDVYAYTLNIDNTKTVASITLPTNYNVKVLAMTTVQ